MNKIFGVIYSWIKNFKGAQKRAFKVSRSVHNFDESVFSSSCIVSCIYLTFFSTSGVNLYVVRDILAAAALSSV